MQSAESVLGDAENCASFVFVVVWWVGGTDAVLQICLSTLSSLSILIQHIGAGLGAAFRTCSLTPGPGLMTGSICCINSSSWHTGTHSPAVSGPDPQFT